MGRWFGYRDGYFDLCHLWMTEDAERWYKHVTRVTGELKRDFLRMKRLKATPKEFGLRVRTHPDTILLITARNKMRTGMDVEEVHDVSLVGRMIESARLYSDKKRNQDNVTEIERFLQRLGSCDETDQNALVWRNVPAHDVADMLDNFLIHPLNFDFQNDSIATYLRELPPGDEVLSRWTVALPTAGDAGEVTLQASVARPLHATRRKVKQSYSGSLLVSGKSARVGSRSDLRHALGQQALRQAGDAPEDELRRLMSRPLLVIYLLRGYEVTAPVYLDGQILPAVGLHFPGAPDPNAERNVVRYRINRVAQRSLLPDESNGDDVDDSESDD
jgi:hypothetical protein